MYFARFTFLRKGFQTAKAYPLWRRSELTVSLWRPLRRRALITRMPFFVLILVRKPCLFLLLRLLGWNVRFISYFFLFFPFRGCKIKKRMCRCKPKPNLCAKTCGKNFISRLMCLNVGKIYALHKRSFSQFAGKPIAVRSIVGKSSIRFKTSERNSVVVEMDCMK